MNEWRSDDRKWCYFHPREMVIGVCALCLKERLLVLVAKKNSLHQTHKTFTKKSPSSSLTKIFALTTLLNRLEIKDHKSSAVDDHGGHSSSSSPDDSFISIKFENNGAASWEKGKLSEISHDHQHEVSNYNDMKIKSLVEHSKPRGVMRWRRRIGHIFHLIRFKKSNKGNICHLGTKPRKSKVL